ncbi:nucleoside recognition domain-containing protein [Blastopirellula marina]|uniref:GTP-binding protein n=1 Tax=Blastopirellula marina TaxID=124 RepID=A0A2S8G1L4_9BACT|nr:nucleoside recognition domain-containing protein [Blastopirellula marina]PQO38024.1 GTP-binding protein [Blastopirellula marina]PTL44680.1 ferrous iron transporter B [Blastopirellula marina]
MSKSTLTEVACQTVLVVGKESTGKSTLISSLAGMPASIANFRGSTVAVERYETDQFVFVDTPGIFRQSDTETTRRALEALEEHETIVLVAQATQLDEDLSELLPMVRGKQGIVVVTYWDKVQPGEAAMEALERLARESGVPFIAVDGRSLQPNQVCQIKDALQASTEFAASHLTSRAGWRIEPKPGILEHRVLGPVLATALLVLPALATIFGANELANVLHPIVETWLEPVVATIQSTWPAWLRILFTNKTDGFSYGLLDMGPFLLVWALPTVMLFSLILGVYKTTGLVERINIALHPYVRHVGLSGRDIVRVMMGFGCNVPAVVSTRACSGCSRGTAIAAIAFGAACSYQLPATLAVLSSVSVRLGHNPAVLSLVYLLYLFLTTLLYLRLTSPRSGRDALNILMTPRRPFMQWPSAGALWREARTTMQQFFWQAMPIFALICVIASLLANAGVLDVMSSAIGPIMAVFNLPADASLPVVLASIRKDGIFLFAGEEGGATPMTAAQTLTAVYLAGVLLPCLVTALTIARETDWQKTALLLVRQAAFAVGFSLVLAWGAWWVL